MARNGDGPPVDWCVACLRQAIATKKQGTGEHECGQTKASWKVCAFCYHHEDAAFNNEAGDAACRVVRGSLLSGPTARR